MEHGTSAPNERVVRTTQLAKLSFNHPSVVLTADVFYFYKIREGGRGRVHHGLSGNKKKRSSFIFFSASVFTGKSIQDNLSNGVYGRNT